VPTTYELLNAADRLMSEAAEMEIDAFDARLTAWLGDGDEKLTRLAAWSRAAAAREARDTEQRDAYNVAIERSKREQERAKALALDLLTKREELGDAPAVPGVARLQANGGKPPLVILDPAAVPPAWCRPAVSPGPDTDRIRAALDAGETIPGVTLGERGRHVRWL
jgi:hypothetical protein